MKKVFIMLVLCLGIGKLSPAQSNLQGNLSYALGLNLNASSFFPEKTEFSTNPALGMGINLAYSPTASLNYISLRPQLNLYSYYSPTENSNIRATNYELHLGIKHIFPVLDSLAMFMHVVPNYARVFALNQGKVGNTGTLQRQYLNPQLNRPLGLGLNLGIQFGLNQYTGLELAYTYQFIKHYKENYVDASPDHFRASLIINFSNIKSEKPPEHVVAAESLQLLREDTFYILNRSCGSYLNERVLDSLLILHYRFSLYKIIQTEEIELIKTRNNSCFFALIGEFYSGEQEPITTGIFLLDSDFELVDYPFPVFTMYPSRSESCFKDFDKTARMIRWFSNRLYKRSDMH